MTQILRLDEILDAVRDTDLVSAMERAFVSYSQGKAVVPPVGELVFDSPPGDAHIKYGYVRGEPVFIVKIASGFYENTRKGLPSNSGLMLVFDSRTGLPLSVLLDEGELTNMRTAAAGATAAKHLANQNVETVGVLGAGVQARMQIEHLAKVRDFKSVCIWARRPEAAEQLVEDIQLLGFVACSASTPGDATRDSDIVVTATPTHQPLLAAADIRPGTHITAMGSDSNEKRELSGDLLQKADIVVGDSLPQCRERGEIYQALKEGVILDDQLLELGNIISGDSPGRRGENDITIADLTGVAVQDIAIANAVLSATKPRD